MLWYFYAIIMNDTGYLQNMVYFFTARNDPVGSHSPNTMVLGYSPYALAVSNKTKTNDP